MTPNANPYSILVVDDDEEIRSVLLDYLSGSGYTVYTAGNGIEALESVLPNHPIDLVLSDINMPKMKGFEFLNLVRETYPTIKRILITAYNVDDYFELAMKHDVGNIFVKTIPFNFKELSTILLNLLTNDIFGAERYMHEIKDQLAVMVTHGNTLEKTATDIIKWLPISPNNKKLELVLIELLINAVFYGIRGEPPERKDLWNKNFELSEADAIQVKALVDESKCAISILDRGGRLKKKDVLYWLHRQICRDAQGLPIGIMDSHGRGFFIVRKYIDRLIVNINTNIKTEIIIINYLDEVFNGYKPLYINEI